MRPLRLLATVVAVLSVASLAPAQTEAATWPAAGFVRTLSIQDQTDAGITKLSADEQTELNACVAREVSLALAGNIRGFAGTFIGRRTSAERTRIGVDQLSPEEQTRLNTLVSVTLASGPVRTESAQAPGKNAVATILNRLEVHGELSLTVGSSGGGHNFYGTSFFTTVTDPESNVTIGVGFEQYKGTGLYGYGFDDYSDGDIRSRNLGNYLRRR